MGGKSTNRFEYIVKQFLLPFFPGTEMGPIKVLPKKRQTKYKFLHTLSGNVSLNLFSDDKKKNGVQIHRSQPFRIAEIELIEIFLEEAVQLLRQIDSKYIVDDVYIDETAVLVITRAIAKFVSDSASDFLFLVLSSLTELAQQTYEGQRVAWSIGVDVDVEASKERSEVKFAQVFSEDFIKVLSNGQDSLLIFDGEGFFVSHCKCMVDEEYPPQFAPFRFEPFASWTRKGGDRVVVTLSRNGEILMFKNGNILFAKRRGRWRYFEHDVFIKLMTKDALTKSSSKELRQEIYRTALDVAFSRHGGCIGVLVRSLNIESLLPKEKCLLPEGSKNLIEGSKNLMLNAMVKEKKFQELDRLLRLELVSMDGATVLDYDGRVIALGAILKIEDSGMAGGGRQAAAEALAKYGIGIKISNDGYIRAFGRDKSKGVLFEVG